MDADLWIELIGYAGSGLVVLSLTRTSIVKLRAIGLAGSLVFLAYSLLIQAYPIAAVNVVIASVHSYFLLKLTRRQAEIFTLLDVSPDSDYLHAFLEFHDEDIGRFQPEFSKDVSEECRVVFVLRDMVPAGLVIGRPNDSDRSIDILLDYAIPQYRDLRLGHFLYGSDSAFAHTYLSASATATTPEHADYLATVGFEAGRTGRYTKTLHQSEL